MPSVCEQITAHMDEIAALISDPVLVRTQPELVAKKFAAAVKKVEMMQTYLPARDKEGLDASVLAKGVQPLVTLTMAKLMIPFTEELPSIITE